MSFKTSRLQVQVTTDDLNNLRHELAQGIASIRSGYNRVSKMNLCDERAKLFFDDGLGKLLDLVEIMDTKYLQSGEKHD